jgi:hypothetical protein
MKPYSDNRLGNRDGKPCEQPAPLFVYAGRGTAVPVDVAVS